MPRRLCWAYLGRVPYAPAAALQERLREDVRSRRAREHLLLLEHPPVFTLGRNAAADDVVAADSWLHQRGVEVHRSKRGGQVTYHGPGQLVGYPIIDLNPGRRSVQRYVWDLQEVLIRTLAELDIAARRREGRAYVGIWVGEGKIASIGVHLARWITMHGFALNVSTDLSFFSGIVACGLREVQMTSIEQLTGVAPSLPEVASRLAEHFAVVFDRRLEPIPAESLTALEQDLSP